MALRALAPGTTIELAASPASEVTASTASGSAPESEPSSSQGPIVHVTGEVVAPGLYELPPGARVADAIAAAGGMTIQADEAALNLAAPAVDGTQIYVLALGEAAPAGAPAPASGTGEGSGSGLINLNTADAAALQELPGIGPALAQRIIDFRQTNGPFASVADLDAVSGIGPTILANIDGLATV